MDTQGKTPILFLVHLLYFNEILLREKHLIVKQNDCPQRGLNKITELI